MSAVSRNRKSTHLEKLQQIEKEVSKSNSGNHNRYLDLFTQLNIIEDSFEFVHLVFHFDPFQCVYAGSTFTKLYGYSSKEIYDHTELFYETAHPDDSIFLMQQIKILLKNGYHEFYYRIITKDNEVKCLKTNAWYQQHEGRSYVVNCFQKDVTRQMKSDNSLKKSLQKHHHISEIAIALNTTDDFDHQLQMTIGKIGRSVYADQVSFYEINNEKMVCRQIWAKQDPIIPQGIVVKIPPLDHLPEYINIFQFSEGENRDGFMRYWEKADHVQSLMLVPIRFKRETFGFIEVVSVKKHRWNADDLRFVCTVGNMTAHLFDRNTINDELNLNHLNHELLANVSCKLNQNSDDNEQILEKTLEYIGEKNMVAEQVFIFTYDEENNLFSKLYDYVNPSLQAEYQLQGEFDGSLFTGMLPALEKGDPNYCSTITQLDAEFCKIYKSLHIKSFLVVPLFVAGKFYGLYGYNVFTHYHDWKRSEIEITQSFAESISRFIERQAIISQLKKSEKRFNDISAKLSGCVFQVTLSPNEDITLDYISPQFEHCIGAKLPSKLTLKMIQQAIHPNDIDTFNEGRKEIGLHHPEISFEGRFFFPTVGFKWLIMRATMLEVKPSGELVYNGVLIDITNNKQTELKLADANITIQSIINNLEVGVLLVDDNNKVLYSNENMKRLLGNELGVNADRSEILDATFNQVRDSAVLRSQTKDMMKMRNEERDKELFIHKTAEFFTRDYIPVFHDFKFFAHLFIFRNVTHAKLQELEVQKSYKRARTIIDHSDVGVVLLSENEKVMIINDQFLRMFYIKEPASYFVNQWFRLLWEKMCENVYIEGITREQIRDTVYSGKRYINQEIVINEINTMQCVIEPVVSDNQIPKEMHETLIQVIDITSQRNIESTLRKSKEEAEAIAKAKSHILTSMSHEIRTPLNGILGFSSMLKESLTDPYLHEMAEVIEQSGHRLLDTVDAILDFSMLQSEKKSYKISSVTVNHMLQEQINVHRAMASQKGLYLYAEIKGVIGIAIADRVLYKILYNLINNAIKYTITGGVKIEAGIVLIEGNEWLELKVIDTGVGIDEIKHRTIFEPFRQVSEGYGRAFEGAGLGLSLVKEYVYKMNGVIQLASRKDEGSTFIVLLPNAYYENNDITPEIIGIQPEVS